MTSTTDVFAESLYSICYRNKSRRHHDRCFGDTHTQTPEPRNRLGTLSAQPETKPLNYSEAFVTSVNARLLAIVGRYSFLLPIMSTSPSEAEKARKTKRMRKANPAFWTLSLLASSIGPLSPPSAESFATQAYCPTLRSRNALAKAASLKSSTSRSRSEATKEDETYLRFSEEEYWVHEAMELTLLNEVLETEKEEFELVDSRSEELFQPSERDINVARLLLLGAAALYGTNFSLVKLLGETDIPVGMSSALRFGMAAIATSPWLLPNPSKENSAADSGEAWKAAALGFEVGVWNSIGYVAQAVGLETTDASKSAFICSLAVVIVPLLDFIGGKQILPRQSIGAAIALAGVAILELGGMDTANFALTNGDIASLVQPVCFGVGFWRMEAAMRQFPQHANRSTAAQLLAVFVVSLSYAAFTDPSSFDWGCVSNWLSSPGILFSLFWTGCISTALTVYMETLALKSLSAAETTLIFSTEPLWGTAFASVVVGETLGWQSGAGALLILGACVYSNLGIEGVRKILSTKTASSESAQSSKETLKQAGAAAAVGAAMISVWNDLSAGANCTSS